LDVIDPVLGSNVVDLGLVYGVHMEPDGEAVIDMTLTSAACPLTDVIADQAAQALDGITNGQRIDWVWMPPWGPDKITEDGRQQLPALGFSVSAEPLSAPRPPTVSRRRRRRRRCARAAPARRRRCARSRAPAPAPAAAAARRMRRGSRPAAAPGCRGAGCRGPRRRNRCRGSVRTPRTPR